MQCQDISSNTDQFLSINLCNFYYKSKTNSNISNLRYETSFSRVGIDFKYMFTIFQLPTNIYNSQQLAAKVHQTCVLDFYKCGMKCRTHASFAQASTRHSAWDKYLNVARELKSK